MKNYLLALFLFAGVSPSRGQAICGTNAVDGNLVAEGCVGVGTDSCAANLSSRYVLCCQPHQIGMVRREQPIDLTAGFFGPFAVHFGSDADTADGMVVLLSPDTINLGACGNPDFLTTGDLLTGPLSRYLALRFDNVPGDGDEMSLITYRDGQMQGHKTVFTRIDGGNIEDEQCHELTVIYDARGKKLLVLIDGAVRLAECLDFIQDVFDGHPFAYVAIAAHTGEEAAEPSVELSSNLSYLCCPTIAACITNSRFGNGWYPLGPIHIKSRWTVSKLGESVRCESNTAVPAIFSLPIDLIDVKINFTVRVDSSDGDCIGMVWGLRQPGCGSPDDYDTYLFSWRKDDQTSTTHPAWMGKKGYLIAKVNGHIPVTPGFDSIDYYFFHNPNNAIFQHLQPIQGQGWEMGIGYKISLIYTTCRTVILIGNDTVFNRTGNFAPGRFGFYDYSQAGARFSNFSYEMLPNFRIETEKICVGAPVTFRCVDACGQALPPGVVDHIRWRFGDGTATDSLPADSATLRPTHVFSTPGPRKVEMIIVNPYGCADKLEKTIEVLPVPTLELDADTLLCTDAVLYSDVTLPAWPGPLEYTWHSTTDSFPGPAHVLADSGLFWVEIRSTYCSVRDSIDVHFLPEITAGVATENPCFAQHNGLVSAAVAGGLPPYTFVLNDTIGSGDGHFSNLLPGFYQLIITDSKGCTVAANALTLLENPYPAVEKAVRDALCFGGHEGALLLRGADPSLRFSLQSAGPFQADTLLDGLAAGNYVLYMQDGFGCGYEQSFAVAEPAGRQLTISAPDTINFGETLLLMPVVAPLDSLPFHYAWSGPFLYCDTCPAPAALPHNTTGYRLTITDTQGCTTVAVKTVVVLHPRALYVANVFSPNGNGQHDFLYAMGGPSVRKVMLFRIFDRWGGQVFEARDFVPDGYTQGWNGKRFGRPLQPGVFAYRIDYETIDGIKDHQEGDITVVK